MVGFGSFSARTKNLNELAIGSSSKYQLFAEHFEEMLSRVLDILLPLNETPSHGTPLQYVYEGQEISARKVGLKKVEFEPLPFSCGKFREAYKGKVYLERCQSDHPSQSLKHLLSCWDIRKESGPSCPCIVKAFKRSHARYAHEWEKDLEVLKEAQSYSQKFNDAGIAPVNIEFTSAFLYRVFAKGCVESGLPLCPKHPKTESQRCEGALRRESLC